MKVQDLILDHHPAALTYRLRNRDCQRKRNCRRGQDRGVLLGQALKALEDSENYRNRDPGRDHTVQMPDQFHQMS